jgi:hypothetical protein
MPPISELPCPVQICYVVNSISLHPVSDMGVSIMEVLSIGFVSLFIILMVFNYLKGSIDEE